MSKILVVDDEQAICWGLEKLGTSMGHEVYVASSAEQGLRLAAECQPDLLILDVRLPGIDGLTAMAQFRNVLGSVPIVVITAFGDLATAVQAVQNGAFEYVLKPFDLAEIRGTIRRAFLSVQDSGSNDTATNADGMLGRTPAMQSVFKQIALAAASDVAVLLEGEPGVGKQLAAQAIHRHSARAPRPFVTVNVAALEPATAEVELFGSNGGGLLEEADGGVLFLEDVERISLPLQVKLLRILEHADLPTVGAESTRPINLRVISSCNQSLLRKVQNGEFRQDLFCFLNRFEITISPLRERQSDILLLARHFAAQRRGTSVTFAEETIAALNSRPWHGNVRELRSAVEHALVVARAGIILPEHLPTALPPLSIETEGQGSHETLNELAKLRAADLLRDPQAEGFVYEKFLEEVEPALLESAMDQFSHECAPAARALGLHRTTLKRKLDQYGLAK
jgi:two-component system, NtrC family, nitrogen regulation response regulator GlnG